MDPTSCRADVMQVQKGELKQSWKLDLVLVKTKSNATNKATDKGGNKSRTSKREGPTNPTETGATLEKKKKRDESKKACRCFTGESYLPDPALTSVNGATADVEDVPNTKKGSEGVLTVEVSRD